MSILGRNVLVLFVVALVSSSESVPSGSSLVPSDVVPPVVPPVVPAVPSVGSAVLDVLFTLGTNGT